MWRRLPEWLRVMLAAAVCLAAGYLVRIPVDQFVHGQIPFMTFFPAVLVAALLGGRWAGLIVVAGATPMAILAAGQYPVAAALVWIVVASAIAWTGGMAYSLTRKLRAERDELKRTRAQLELVVRELGHRARNTFAILKAFTAQSAHGASSVEEFRDRLLERIRALTSAYSLLSDRDRQALELSEIVRTALAPFEAAHAGQMRIDAGPECRLSASTGVSMVLCLHELATNAVKYGALAVQQGQVTCNWSGGPDGAVTLRWRESGGPKVTPPKVKGFGSRVIDSALSSTDGGKVEHRFEPDGVACDLTFRPGEPAEQSGYSV